MCTELTYWKKSSINAVSVGSWCYMISMSLFLHFFYIFGGNIAKPHQWQVVSVEVIFVRRLPLRLTGWNSATSGILQCFPYWLLLTLYDWLPLVTLFQRLGGVSLAQPQVAHTPSVQWAVHGQSSWQVFSLSLSSSWCISIWREFVSIFVSKKNPSNQISIMLTWQGAANTIGPAKEQESTGWSSSCFTSRTRTCFLPLFTSPS